MKKINEQEYGAAKIQQQFSAIGKKKELLKLVGELETELFPLFKNEMVFCPICKDFFQESDYLKTVIDNKKTLWIANMVTHYRHTHIKSWDRCWDTYSGRHYRSGWFGDYDDEKQLVNERAKRQIVRKCTAYLKHNNITLADFQGLEHNDEMTLNLIIKKLGK